MTRFNLNSVKWAVAGLLVLVTGQVQAINLSCPGGQTAIFFLSKSKSLGAANQLNGYNAGIAVTNSPRAAAVTLSDNGGSPDLDYCVVNDEQTDYDTHYTTSTSYKPW